MKQLGLFCISIVILTIVCDDSEPVKTEDCGCSVTNRENVEKEVIAEEDDNEATVEDVEETLDDSSYSQKNGNHEMNNAKEKYTSAANAQSNYERSNQMIYISEGQFEMGLDKPIIPADGESPSRKVSLDSFWLDVFEVSNAEFEVFVNNTGFVSEAEKFGNSFVFDNVLSDVVRSETTQMVQAVPWWLLVDKASWKHPYGHDSDIKNTMDHPVVHVSWNDAVEYCAWAGKRLPTEAEFEYACRDGRENRLFPWGNIEVPKKGHRMNFFQGKFPENDLGSDGFKKTCSVGTYGPQTKSGLRNIVGNVWEWVSDWWTTEHSSSPSENPIGPTSGTDKVKKGGSSMCSVDYCFRHRCGARSSNTPDSSASNLGFRCAASELPEYLQHHNTVKK